MKQFINLSNEPMTEYERLFIMLWKKNKKYEDYRVLSLGECLELIIATTYNLHHEESDTRFFNHILTNDESLIAWEGTELIDILFFEALQGIKKRLASSYQFPQD